MTSNKPRVPLGVEGGRGLEPGAIWRLISVAGVMFLLVGGIDTLLVAYPPAFGVPEWEFGSITAGLNGLPLPTLGLVLILAAALRNDRLVLARIIAVAMGAMALLIVGAAILYLTNVPLAINAVGTANDAARQGLLKSIVKTATQLVCYPVGLAILTWKTWQLTRSRK